MEESSIYKESTSLMIPPLTSITVLSMEVAFTVPSAIWDSQVTIMPTIVPERVELSMLRVSLM